MNYLDRKAICLENLLRLNRLINDLPRYEKCCKGCIGYFTDDGTGEIHRCDDCNIYSTDKAAQLAAQE
jgi:rRNA maturation endonuclease Nob1